MRNVLLAAALLGACASPQELAPPELPRRASLDAVLAERAEGARFVAAGEEFHLRFFDDYISLSFAGGAEQIFPMPEPQYPRWNGEIYTTRNTQHRLIVRVRHDRVCPTQPGAHQVEILFDGSQLLGCGRSL
jgi:hypothetical protein